MAWYDDPIFDGEPDPFYADQGQETPFQLKNMGRPAFRLSLQSAVTSGHPLDHLNAWRALFDVFAPILKRDAERLIMVETPGKGGRRRKSIKKDDWDPFGHMAAKIPEDDRLFIGFDFQSGSNGDDRFDIGPTKFFLAVRDKLSLTACVPVPDFDAGALDIDALKAALLALPVYSGNAGYGMCLTDTFDWDMHGEEALLPVARKYPALELCKETNRRWLSSPNHNAVGVPYWAVGINWLTLIHAPLVEAMGGVKALTEGLDSAITWQEGPHGLLFQLGDRPITGESGQDDALLPLYSELGQRMGLADGSLPEALERHYVFGTQNDEMMPLSHAWARRFYDGAWLRDEVGS